MFCPIETVCRFLVENANVKTPCVSRRDFLLAGGSVITTAALSPMMGCGASAFLKSARYEKKFIARISELEKDVPVEFKYPFENSRSTSFLVRLGEPAAGGLGPGQDIVAFNSFCTHMGGLLNAVYQKGHKVAGPCPIHLTTFDLTRHGMVVAGHATASLPQVILETTGDKIHAVGISGLVYGRSSNV